jgi:hypothetical protein
MKRILITCLLIVVLYRVSAQIPGFNVGPKIGYNTNRLTTDFDSISSDPDGAFQFGAFIRVGKKIYFQPEVNYVVKGGEISIEGIGSQEIELQSITIPLLIGFRPIQTGAFNVRFMAGPTMSFISGKTLKPSEILGTWPIKTTDDIKNTLWSFQMGGGVDIFFMTLDLRYELGVDNIYSGESDFSLKNNLFNICLGIKLL